MNDGASQLRNQKRELDRELNKFATKVGVEAKNWYKNSFRIGGFVDVRYTRWRQRKNRDSGRAVLVKTGNLRDSIKVITKSYLEVMISSSTTYGKFHNEGTSRLPKRQFIGNSYHLNQRILKIIDNMVRSVVK